MDIPDTDGVIILRNTKGNVLGKFVECKVTDIKNYDLIGDMCNE